MTINSQIEQFGAILDLDWIACVDSIWAGHFLCLNGVRHVLNSGEIKVEAWKTMNYTRKRNPCLKGTLSYPILSYLQLQGGILITFQHSLPNF